MCPVSFSLKDGTGVEIRSTWVTWTVMYIFIKEEEEPGARNKPGWGSKPHRSSYPEISHLSIMLEIQGKLIHARTFSLGQKREVSVFILLNSSCQ